MTVRKFIAGLFLCGLFFFFACGRFNGRGTLAGFLLFAPRYTVSGVVTGYSGSGLVLSNNGGDYLSIAHSGTFTFASSLDGGAAYSVAVATQPSNPSQTCTVTGASGSMNSMDVSGIQVSCTTNSYSIQVSVAGLSGSGLVLQNSSNGDTIAAINANGTYTFATPVMSGVSYNIVVSVQPSSPAQTCSVSAGSGTVGGANVTGITINCSLNSYTIGGNLSGYSASVGAPVLKDSISGQTVTLSANGAYSFSSPIVSGQNYNVTLQTLPTNPWQTCSVTGGSGTVSGSNVTNIDIACSLDAHTVGISISGLTGATGIVLTDSSNGDTLSGFSADGSYTFSSSINSGMPYNVSVSTQPTGRTCTVASGSGTIANADVVLTVTCSTNTYNISGTVSGFPASGSSNLVILENTTTQTVSIPAGAAVFNFATPVAYGTTYAVSVQSFPAGPDYTCSIANASGTITGTVSNVDITCTAGQIQGGTIIGVPPFSGSPQITTVAGDYPASTPGMVDALGNSARFDLPDGLATDGTNLYIADDTNQRIRKMVIATGQVSTIATGIVNMSGLTSDGNFLFFTANSMVYKLQLATGTITFVAGGKTLAGGVQCAGSANTNCYDGTGAQAQFGTLQGVTTDGVSLYIADESSNRIRKINIASGVVTTLAGNGSTGVMNSPYAIATDGYSLFVTDRVNDRLLLIDRSTGAITVLFTTICGAGGAMGPYGIATDGTNLYAMCTIKIMKYDSLLPGHSLTQLAGTVSGYVDGAALSAARIYSGDYLVSDGTHLFFTDFFKHSIRRYY